MNRLTLAIIRNSDLPGIIGQCSANLGGIRNIVNRSQERILLDPLAPEDGWWGGYAEMEFAVSVDAYGQGYITPPRDVARLGGMTICANPVLVRNRFYEYMAFGNGLRTGSRSWRHLTSPMQAIERDNVVTQADLVGNKYLRFYISDPGDSETVITPQGLDNNGKPVLRMDVNTGRAVHGEQVAMIEPFATSTFQYSKLTGIMKPNTLGQVTITQVDDNGDELPLLVMEPGETTALYRRYFLMGMPFRCCPGTSGQVSVTAMAKLDLVPAMSDSDPLLIQCKEAIIEECQAVAYSSKDSVIASKKMAEHHQYAMALMFGQLDHFLGKTKTSISVPIWGSDTLTRQPI